MGVDAACKHRGATRAELFAHIMRKHYCNICATIIRNPKLGRMGVVIIMSKMCSSGTLTWRASSIATHGCICWRGVMLSRQWSCKAGLKYRIGTCLGQFCHRML